MASPSQNIPPVYQYIWRDYGLPHFQSLVMTIDNKQSLVFFALFAIALTYTQTRVWVLLKSSGLRISRPIELSLDPSHPRHPDSIRKLSQIAAVMSLFSSGSLLDHLPRAALPKRVGYAAITNFVVFFVLGVVMPLYLTGNLSTAVVRSKIMGECIGAEDRLDSKLYTAQLANSFFNRCSSISYNVSSSCPQESGIIGSMPRLHVEMQETCPFLGNVCQDSMPSVQIAYKGLRPRDYGVNLNERVLVDHRVTCAPLRTEKFLVHPNPQNGTTIWFGRPFNDPNIEPPRSAIYGMMLETANGPNGYSNEFSGGSGSAYDVNVYPYFPFREPSNVDEDIDQRLRRDDAYVFIIMLRAGKAWYPTPIDDPLYAAHNKVGDFYSPDYEATALGCAEQFRLCLNETDSSCTLWGIYPYVAAHFVVSKTNPKFGSRERKLTLIYLWLTHMASLKVYLEARTGTQILLTNLLRNGNYIGFIDPKEQWVKEISAWFTTAFLNARFSIMQIVRRQGPKGTEDVREKFAEMCGIVLFQSNEHTNVDFIGLIVSISVLLLICAASHRDKIKQALKVTAKAVGKIGKAIYNLICKVPAGVIGIVDYVHSRAEKARQDYNLRREQQRTQFPRGWWHGPGRFQPVVRASNDEIELSQRIL